MKSKIIFKGKTKPSSYFIGISNQPRDIKDKFGKLQHGEVRSCIINTQWGQLSVPKCWMKKKIKISVTEVMK